MVVGVEAATVMVEVAEEEEEEEEDGTDESGATGARSIGVEASILLLELLE